MGNDTRVHRIAPLPQYVFEIDAEKTQQHKLKNHVLNEKVVFVPVNFEEESWKDKLHAIAGEEVTHRKTLFIWDGVTYYHQRGHLTNLFMCIDIPSSAAGWEQPNSRAVEAVDLRLPHIRREVVLGVRRAVLARAT